MLLQICVNMDMFNIICWLSNNEWSGVNLSVPKNVLLVKLMIHSLVTGILFSKHSTKNRS